MLAGREDELYTWFKQQDFGHEWSRLGLRVRLNHFEEVAASLALDALIAAYERDVAQTRDRISSSGRPEAAFDVVGQQLNAFSRGIQAIAPELEELLDKPWFERDLSGLEWVHPGRSAHDAPAKSITRSYRLRAKTLHSAEKAVRELLVAGAQIAGAREGLRLQRGSRLIALLALGVSVSSLVTIIFANADRIQAVLGTYGELFRP